MPRCEIKHWDTNSRDGPAVVFHGRPLRTLMRYIKFLDNMKTDKLFEGIREWMSKA